MNESPLAELIEIAERLEQMANQQAQAIERIEKLLQPAREPPWCCLCNTRHTLLVGCPTQ